jgi:BASS family bile acid:Na+ symporter
MSETPAALQIGLPIALLLIMGSLGLSLTPADFRRVASRPRGVLVGLGNLFVLSPLLAFLVATVLDLEPVLAAGLVLLGSTPGGTTANLMTHLARGDVALSVSMTALSSVAAVVTVPLYLGAAVDHFGAAVDADVGTAGVAVTVLLITVVPLAAGMAVRARRPAWAIANEGRAKVVAILAFVGVIVAAATSELETLTEHIGDLAVAALALNLLAMGCSFAIARLARLDVRQCTAVALELGVHNGTVAIAVATLVDDRLAAPAIVYGVFMYGTAGAFAAYLNRRNAPAAQPAGLR